jgi:hypothetical protein
MPPHKPVLRRHPSKEWLKYLDPKMRMEAFCISGAVILLQTSDPSFRRLVYKHWSSFAVPISTVKKVHAVFQFFTGPSYQLPRLKKWYRFMNERVLFLSDGKRYLLTGYFYDHPWQIHCRSMPDWNPDFIYYYVFEPILLDLLKKLGILIWHSAAVARNGMAILVPGVSGSGKSTTALNLLSLGYRFLADDQVLLRSREAGLEVQGYESGVYLTDTSLDFLPEWKKFKSGSRRKKGRRWKHRIELKGFILLPRSKPPMVKFILFPSVTKRRDTKLEQLTKAGALLECLRQVPKEYPRSMLGKSAMQSQFEIYSMLVASARSYRIHLGTDQEEVRRLLLMLESDKS